MALCNCEPIFLRFLKERIVFRGGISYGDAYIDLNRSMFFGEAINKAYQLESKSALHPRIVVEPEVAEKVEESIPGGLRDESLSPSITNSSIRSCQTIGMF